VFRSSVPSKCLIHRSDGAFQGFVVVGFAGCACGLGKMLRDGIDVTVALAGLA
jgi:hypothetical protein